MQIGEILMSLFMQKCIIYPVKCVDVTGLSFPNETR